MNIPTHGHHGHRKRGDLHLSAILEIMLVAAVLTALVHGVPVLTHLSI
jgi:hypothetical protein